MNGEFDGIEITPDFAARFKLGDRLGTGAAGTVRAAIHRDTRRPVAVKFLRRLGDPGITERFLREARLLARVQHVNVLKVFEMGEVSGHPFLVTPLVPGGTLRHRIKQGRVLAPEALELAGACLDGLSACHEAGFIHRDVKPENILIDADGAPVIADLGIARCLETHAQLTLPGTVMGTPRYMSPEQACGEPVGPGTDLYAMGVILYELLSGTAPFNHNDHNVMLQLHIEAPPPPLAPGTYPRGLEELVARALAKRAEDRPASARAFADELRALLTVRARARVRSSRAPVPPTDAQTTPGTTELAGRPAEPATRVALESGVHRTLNTPPAAQTGPLMLFACLAAGLMTLAALAPWRPRDSPVKPSPAPSAHASTPVPGADPAALALRLGALQRGRERADARTFAVRTALEEDRGAGQLPNVRAALLEADEDVRLTRELVGELDEARAAATDDPPPELTRALALQWLALSRQCWLRQKIHLLARPNDDWTRLAESGPEAASGALLPPLRRWLNAAERDLKRPASMPSMAGPEIADLLDEVHAVAMATYVLDWHRSAQPLVDKACKAFLADVARLSGMAAPLVAKIVVDLWRWGHAEGATMAYAAGVMFDENRERTVADLGSLASFLAPPAREAVHRLIARARAGFRATP